MFLGEVPPKLGKTRFLVPGAGIEPARSLPTEGF